MLERDPSQHVSLQNNRRNGDLQETNRVLRLAYADTRFFNHDPHDSDDRYWFVAFWNLHPALRKHRCTTNYQAEKTMRLQYEQKLHPFLYLLFDHPPFLPAISFSQSLPSLVTTYLSFPNISKLIPRTNILRFISF